MEQILENGSMQAVIDPLGAQLLHLKQAGREYLWQGDARYWRRRAPLLFPFIARLAGEQYRYEGRVYPMPIHGFLSHRELTVEEKSQSSVTLRYRPEQADQEIYPFDFRFSITYRLLPDTLLVCPQIENCGDVVLHASLGWHPGFRVPLEEGLSFEDYALCFDPAARPQRLLFDAENLLTGASIPFPLEEGRLPLAHSLFDEDAILLQEMGDWVTLCAKNGRHSLTLHFPGTRNLALWHRPHTDAPYVCLEPWSAVPGHAGRTEEPALRPDFFHLLPGQSADLEWRVSLK